MGNKIWLYTNLIRIFKIAYNEIDSPKRRTKMKRVSLFVIIILTIFLAGGCANKDIEPTGFLSDYSKLQPGQGDQPLKRYVDPTVDFSKYKKVMIDKVIFYFKNDSREIGIDPDELKMLADYFHDCLIKNLQDRYPVVSKPGPDVLRIRVAITNVKAGNPVLGAASAVLPVGVAVNALSNVTTGESINVGEATIEAEFLDSETGKVVAAIMDRKVGSTYSTGSVKGKWGHAKQAFQEWAQKLRKWLDEVHDKKARN